MMELPMGDTRKSLSDGAAILRIVSGLVLCLFTLSYVAGFVVGRLESGRPFLTPKVFFTVAPAILIAFCSLYFVIDAYRRRETVDGPIAPRERRSRLLIWASVGLGVVMGVLSIPLGLMDSIRDPVAYPLDPRLATILLVMMVLILPPLSWLWHRSIDEHERETYRNGAVVAAYAYMIITPIWWVGARMGILPPADGATIYFGFSLILVAVWLWHRSL